jgi:hypothetical protein
MNIQNKKNYIIELEILKEKKIRIFQTNNEKNQNTPELKI